MWLQEFRTDKAGAGIDHAATKGRWSVLAISSAETRWAGANTRGAGALAGAVSLALLLATRQGVVVAAAGDAATI